MNRPRMVFGLLVVLVLIAAWFLRPRSPETPLQQAKKLHEVRPFPFAGLELTSWSRIGTKLDARYEGRRSSAGFALRILPSEGAAQSWFQEAVTRLAGDEPIQEVNAFEGLEECVRDESGTRCVGHDGNHTLESWTAGRRDFSKHLDALGVLRVARKHWYRVFKDSSR